MVYKAQLHWNAPCKVMKLEAVNAAMSYNSRDFLLFGKSGHLACS